MAAGLPVGGLLARVRVVCAYAVPAVVSWLALGLCLGGVAALTGSALSWVALAALIGYGGYYGVVEALGRPGLAAPGRRWQVPQTMLIGASPRRRLLVWGTILGPGFLTRNPYAGFGLLPIAVGSMVGWPAVVALACAVGLAHGTARGLALLRDVRELRDATAGPSASHLDVLLKTVYWRRLDGMFLLAAVVPAVIAISARS